MGKGVGSTAKYTYDGQDVLLDDGLDGIVKYQNGLGIDDKLSVQNGSAKSYFLSDHLGSTNGLADNSGNLTSSASYDSFGNATGNLATRYQYTGREKDEFTGLYYYRARHYDGKLGRFTSEDPIGFAGGDVNLYGYVWNNPQNFIDPSGHYPRPILIGRFTPITLDEIQGYLALAGLVPGIGEVADGLDGIISLARGDYCGAALSGAAMIPFAGTAAGAAKVGRKLKNLQSKFDKLADAKLLPKYREMDPNLKAGYTGSFNTGVVGNSDKDTFGQPINLDDFDIIIT